MGPAEMREEGDRWLIPMPDYSKHRPDLGLVVNDGRSVNAIEVELHAKSRKRVGQILDGYRRRLRSGELSRVYYFTDKPHVRSQMERGFERAGLDKADAGLVWLPSVIDGVRSPKERES
jgi:hypothetical protein